MIDLLDVTKVYQQGRRAVHALRGVSLRIEFGEFVAIMGPSGSGKSTLLHLMGALDVPTSGSIRIGGSELERLSDRERSLLRRRRIGFVFQFFNLLPSLTAAENVALPLLLDGQNRIRARRQALAALEQMNLLGRRPRNPRGVRRIPVPVAGNQAGLSRLDGKGGTRRMPISRSHRASEQDMGDLLGARATEPSALGGALGGTEHDAILESLRNDPPRLPHRRHELRVLCGQRLIGGLKSPENSTAGWLVVAPWTVVECEHSGFFSEL
jgi:hypothetical protein